MDAPYGGDDDDFTDRGQDSELNALVQQLESFAEKRTGRDTRSRGRRRPTLDG